MTITGPDSHLSKQPDLLILIFLFSFKSFILIFNSVCNFSEFFELQQPFGLESGLLLIQQKTCFSKNI